MGTCQTPDSGGYDDAQEGRKHPDSLPENLLSAIVNVSKSRSFALETQLSFVERQETAVEARLCLSLGRRQLTLLLSADLD